MLSLSWIAKDWRYSPGIIIARFADCVIDIPVGKSRKGAFYLFRTGEDGWKIAPVKFPNNKREPFDDEGRYSDFIYIYGAPESINDALSKD